MDITFYILYILEYPKHSMGMNMGIDFENLIDMDMGMRMTFENRYECWYSYTHPESALCQSLLKILSEKFYMLLH